MKKNKDYGITLVALIITIIILLILAGISIVTLGGNNGIFTKAKEAKNNTLDAQNTENATIQDYEDKINSILEENNTPQGPIKKVEEVKDKVISITKNVTVQDEYGNQIVVPAGFKITTDASNVTQGIVIEDMTEGQTQANQFVWVPVGKIYTNIEKTESEAKTINLNRYTFDSDGTPVEQNNEVIYSYFQELETSTYGNTVAKSISDFKTSVTNNHGYYIGRYEAGNNNDIVICKSSANVWSMITQPIAATKAREMYNNTKLFTSDLINSYAWDTAIVFEEKFGTNDNYANRESNHSFAPIETGTSGDVQCNIYDMAVNVMEWTTEYSSSGFPCVFRGGSNGIISRYFYTSYRKDTDISDIGGGFIGFRPILYL